MTEPAASFWLDRAGSWQPPDPGVLPARADVVVIGGGMTGLRAAQRAAVLGAHVVLLEQRALVGGATGRNGGHVVAGPADSTAETVRLLGMPAAREIWDFTLHTINAMREFVAAESVECDLRFAGTARLAFVEKELAGFEADAALLQTLGIAAQPWSRAECATRTHSDAFIGGLFYPHGGQLWPAKLARAVAAAAARAGARLHSGVQVHAVTADGAMLQVQTSAGALQARAVIHASNGWARRLLPELHNVLVPVIGQVLATAPAAHMWDFGLVANDGYEYWRQLPDGRIVLGGMRWRSATMGRDCDDDTQLDAETSAALRAFLPAHFDALAALAVEYEWSGVMCYTPDAQPLVGALPGRPGEYIAAGYTGHGMPLAFMAGCCVAELALGAPPTITANAFSPKRFDSTTL